MNENKAKWGLACTLSATVFAFGAACSPQDHRNPPPTETNTQERNSPSLEFIKRSVSIKTLDRMLGEEDSRQVIESAGKYFKEGLLESGAVTFKDNAYSAEVNISKWETSDNLTDNTHLNEVDAGISEILRLNEVTWCESPTTSGKEFVQDYMDQYGDSSYSYEGYADSIADYVDCGTGEL